MIDSMSSPSPSAPSQSSSWVKDVSTAEFPTAVLERSRDRPVVVDFWAAWCGPCRVLGPVLEREVQALGGRVELAKLDTDANPQLAMDFGIQGIPAVKAFRNGAVVSEFVGARPAPFVREWLAALVPPPELAALEEAEQAARAGDRAKAEPALRKLADGAPGASARADIAGRALAALVRLLLDAQEPDAAEPLLARLEARGDAADVAESLRRRLQFFADAAKAGGLEAARAALERDAADREARFSLASALAAAGQSQAALDHFLELAPAARKPRGEDARRAMLAVFDQLGPEHPLTREYRRRLQIVT
jgi:putative thioredoxin